MNLRIYRTWSWQPVPGAPVLIGGPPAPLRLVAHDALQHELPDGSWQAVTVVEAEKPEHPADIEHRARIEELQGRLVKDFAELARPPEKRPCSDGMERSEDCPGVVPNPHLSKS